MTHNGGWEKYLLGIVAGIAVSLTLGAIVAYGRLATVEEKVASNAERMRAMEDGLTTPMSVVTRERFDAVDNRLEKIEERLERLIDQLHALQGVTREKKRGAGSTSEREPLPPFTPVPPPGLGG